ncbi:uncharacterized protein LOC135137305 [Zophobas morio]|uniref:uncharacterized protein LOC135137305 n=1 Tax=Zophobas morio TaxID=2755281 RepID=UPI003082F081
MANDDVHIFIKREGTGDKGRDYENLFVSNVSLRLAKDNNQEFLISSNNGKFGSFDDVVMESINQVNFALQLKHSETAKHLNLESLGAKTENISVELDDGEKFSVKITECQADPLINTSKTSDKCYTFEVIKKQNYYSKKLDAYEEFFKKFYLYTDQCNVDQLKDEVYRQMRELFSCEDKICNRYLQYVSDWSKRSGKKEKLTTKTVQRIIALYLVDPFICSMNFDSECSNGKLLREAIFYFRVTVFKGNLESVVKIWTNLKNKQIENENNIITNKMYQISSKYVGTTDKLNDKEKTLLLWLLDECPLIVRMDDLVCKAIKFCTSGKFVLIGTNDNNFNRSNTLKDVEIFQNLSNLKDKNGAEHETWKSIIADFKCGLPGKEYSIEELIQEHSKLQTNINLNTIITTDDLLKMTDNGNIYKIQFRNEELPSPYIQRSVATHRINRKYLDTLDDSTLIVISNVTEQDQILFKHYSLVIVDEYLNTNVKNVLSSKKKQIYISESLCSQATFKKICDRNDGVKKCQHFKLSNRMLEWVKSNNEFVDLEKYYVKQELKFVEEKELFSLNAENNIHLISDHAGTGKSSLLKNFNNNNNSSQKLSMFLTPKEMLKICQHLKHKEMDEVENFIIDLKHSNDSAFVKEILKSMLHCGNIVYIWDALDEIEENYLEDIHPGLDCKNI